MEYLNLYYVKLHLQPLMNIGVEDEIDELDAVEVHYDEIHEPQEPIKQIAPNTSSYHSLNEYYDTFLHWMNQQADDTDKMLLAFSKHFQSIDYLLDPPLYASGKLNFTGQLPNCENNVFLIFYLIAIHMQYISLVIRPNQKIQLTILELGGDGKWYEMDGYWDATLLNVPNSE
uniref:Uncharacterized protein n=1 Tax=Romanomermis culicivorax TaxID=13658 RepID=A0A915HI37_ROMCU